MQLALTPPSVGARATADGNASGASGQWDDADQALMELLLLDSQDVAASPSPSPPPHKDRAVTIEAKTKTKAKLTATEKKARHREVVRRSYHRTKATTKVLKDEVKQLEEQFRALTSGRSADDKTSAGASASANEASLARIDALKEQVASLDATTEQLRKESAKLQFGLLRHQEYARVVVETFQDDLMDESTSEDDEDTTSTTASLGSSSTASSDDGSPVRTAGVKRALYAIPRPTHVVDLSQPAPVAREARKDIGFVPLKPMDVKLICNATVSDIVNFTLSGRVVSSGARVLGWEDRRLIDGPTVRFSLRKTFPSRNSYDLMAKTWQCFSDPECVHQKFQGLMELRILQRVNDDTVIALRDTLNPENNKVYRFVFMLFRMRTTRGFLIGVKSLDDPKFITEQHKHTFTRDGREIQWVDLSGWFLFDRQVYVDPHTGVAVEAGAEVEYGGVMNYGDVAHTMTLAMNTLSLVLKWESFMIGPIFALPPSSD